MSPATPWHHRRERGAWLGMRLTAWLYRHLGWAAAHLLVYPIVGYFFLTDPDGRRASRDYLRHLYQTPGGAQALGARPGLRHVFRHFLEFGISILDRLGFWMGNRESFTLVIRGRQELDRVAQEGRGAIVLGSHLGSFDAMRLLAETDSPILVHLLMYTRHAARINAIFQELERLPGGSEPRVRVIPIPPAGVEHVLEARTRVGRGEIVAVLADRVPPNEVHRVSHVKFLGGEAILPQGPILLAALLGCPVLLMAGIRTGRRSYEIQVERFADRIDLPRSRRGEAMAEHCQAFADRLASWCVRAPYQWFNFYDFWREERSGVGP